LSTVFWPFLLAIVLYVRLRLRFLKCHLSSNAPVWI